MNKRILYCFLLLGFLLVGCAGGDVVDDYQSANEDATESFEESNVGDQESEEINVGGFVK